MKTVEIVRTPKNWEEIESFISFLPKAARAHATVVAIMAWNFACEIARKEKEDRDL